MEENKQNFEIQRLVKFTFKYLYVPILGVFFFIFGAYLYLRYVEYKYQSEAILKIELQTEFSMENKALDPSGQEEQEAQLEVIKSNEIINKVISTLKLDVKYFTKGKIGKTEFYKNSPIVFRYDSTNFKLYSTFINIKPLNQKEFLLWVNQEDTVKGTFDNLLKFKGNDILISKRAHVTSDIYYVYVQSTEEAFSYFLQTINFSPYKPGIFKIIVTDVIPERAYDFLKELLKVYLEDELSIKKRSLDQEIQFIDTLINEFSKKLQKSESDLETFEKTYEIPVIQSKKQSIISTISQFETELNNIKLSNKTLEDLERYVQVKIQPQDKDIVFAPNMEGLVDPILVQNVNQLNQLLVQKSILLKKHTINSPLIQKINDQISEAKKVLLESIENSKEKNKEKVLYIKQKSIEANVSLSNIPSLERDLSTVKKPFELNEKIYYSLLDKKMETSIQKAAIVSNSRIINKPMLPKEPVSPKPIQVYLMSSFIGLIIGLGFILFRYLTDRTLTSREEVESVTDVPIIGTVIKSNQISEVASMQVITNPRSHLTECFRTLRANIMFTLSHIHKPVLSITSTASEEGKTFISVNTAGVLSLLDKKIILLDLDLRKPRLHLAFHLPNEKGVSNLLVNPNMDFKEVIQFSGYNNLDVITSGPIPPNPSEMLNSQEFIDLLEKLKSEYDIIVCDTAPVGLVTDTIPVLKLSHLALYIYRANKSDRSFLKNAEALKNEHQLKHLYLLINYLEINTSSYGYAYGYGYGYGYTSGYYVESEKISLWKKIKNYFKS